MKNCSKCFLERKIDDFPKTGNICKGCISQARKLYYQNNKEKIKEKVKLYASLNREKVNENKKKYHKDNREEILIKQKKYREDNKEAISECKKEWYGNNKHKVKKYQQDNREHFTLKKKEHYHKNKERYNYLNRIYIRNKKDRNPIFKLSCSIRTLISQSFKLQYTKKSKKTIEILGCTFTEFKNHIESKFISEMSWSNYATYWQLDHIVPISWAKTEEEVYNLNHHLNFQPLERKENIRKGNRYSS